MVIIVAYCTIVTFVNKVVIHQIRQKLVNLKVKYPPASIYFGSTGIYFFRDEILHISRRSLVIDTSILGKI